MPTITLPLRKPQNVQQNREKLSKPHSSCRKAALSYARMGYKVLPIHGILDGQCTCGNNNCRSPGKHPLTKHGVHDATADIEQVKVWYRENPHANVAIATGRKADLLVLDIDPRNGGDKSLNKAKEELGKLPRTVAVDTGGGGRHYYLQSPEDFDTATQHGKVFGNGIDVQAEGAYVMAPPSLHVSGKRYCFRDGRSFEDTGVKPLPDLWKARLTAPQRVKTPRAATPSSPQTIHEGCRNQELTSVAGKLHNAGLSEQALLDALSAENKNRCIPPLADDEVQRIARSVARYPVNTAGVHEAEIVAQITLERHFAGGEHLVYAADGQFWGYEGKKWDRIQHSYLDSLTLGVIKSLPQPPRLAPASLLKQVSTLLKAQVAINDDRLGFTKPSPVINCQNCELWISDDGTVTPKPHSAKSYLRHCLDVTYDPSAASPLYDRAIAEIFSRAADPKAMIDFWHELTGYIAQPSRDIPIIIIGEEKQASACLSMSSQSGSHWSCWFQTYARW
jgi:putative DNA primase/helicase